MKVAIIGSNGQLGTDLVKAFRDQHEVICLTHKDIEVADYSSCQILKEYMPDAIINTAAFHKTDQCEEEPSKAFMFNSIGAKNIASICKEIDAVALYISTDYVFDGSKDRPYTEEDTPRPINTYGISKLAGELFTSQAPKHYIIRTASLFGSAGASGKGGNFIETILSKAKRNEQINVVDDMWMSPTYTKDAAQAIKKIVEGRIPYGIYHVANRGFCSWFQLAEKVFEFLNLKPDLSPVKTEQMKQKARRPPFSALISIKLERYGIEMRKWQEALYAYLVEKGYIT